MDSNEMGVSHTHSGQGDAEVQHLLVFPIASIDGNKFQLKIDLTFFSKDAITSTTYEFTDKFFIILQRDLTEPNIALAIFEAKEGSSVDETDVKRFCNKLIDQQVRISVNNEFGKIRDMIVAEAFKPISR